MAKRLLVDSGTGRVQIPSDNVFEIKEGINLQNLEVEENASLVLRETLFCTETVHLKPMSKIVFLEEARCYELILGKDSTTCFGSEIHCQRLIIAPGSKLVALNDDASVILGSLFILSAIPGEGLIEIAPNALSTQYLGDILPLE